MSTVRLMRPFQNYETFLHVSLEYPSHTKVHYLVNLYKVATVYNGHAAFKPGRLASQFVPAF